MIIFRSYLPCREGDDLSIKTVMEEINLGIRVFMNFMGYLVRAIDGEKYEEIFEENEKTDSINTSGEIHSEEVYIPAAKESASKLTEGMYV